jgi:hypothetical protein
LDNPNPILTFDPVQCKANNKTGWNAMHHHITRIEQATISGLSNQQMN